MGMETHSRSRSSVVTYSLLGIFLAVLVVGTAVGWSAYKAERERQRQRELLVDGAYIAATEIARAFGVDQAVSWCAVAGFAALGPIGAGFGVGFCGALASGAIGDLSEALRQKLFDRPYHPEAAALGRVVGVIGGAIILAPLSDFPSYASRARALTETTYRSHHATIDPGDLRGVGYHLHHVMPLRCGFALGIPEWLMAGSWNLEMITADANRRIGAMGCAD
jgi:hypothetical protein